MEQKLNSTKKTTRNQQFPTGALSIIVDTLFLLLFNTYKRPQGRLCPVTICPTWQPPPPLSFNLIDLKLTQRARSYCMFFFCLQKKVLSVITLNIKIKYSFLQQCKIFFGVDNFVYVPERSFMHVTVSACFLIRFALQCRFYLQVHNIS